MELLKQEFMILDGFTETMRAPTRMRYALNQPDPFHSTTLKDVEGFMLCMFFGENALKEKYARCLSNPTSSVAVETMEKPYRDQEILCYR